MSRVLKEYPTVALKIEELEGKIDFVQIFGRPDPVHIEVGSGKAAFLLNQAKAQPKVNFLGIEWASRYYRYAVDRIGRWGLTNVRIIRADAAGLLNLVPNGFVDCFHIYFPDPWPKRRHQKRRFFTPANLSQIIRCLKKGGELRIATDHLDYFQKILELIDTQGDSLEKIDFLPAAGASQGEWLGTNFERKYIKENRPIYTLAVRKT
jgi:tRNA (guanine-N7-)-methyltransferase